MTYRHVVNPHNEHIKREKNENFELDHFLVHLIEIL